LQVDQDPDPAAAGIAGLAHGQVGLAVHIVGAVGQVQPGDIHPGIHQFPDLLGRGNRRAQRGHDLGSAHGRILCVNGYTISGRADARMGEGRLVVPIR